MRIVFGVRNDGARGARNYYWHLWIPDSLGPHQFTGDIDQSELMIGAVTLDDDGPILYRHYSDHIAEPLYPTRTSTPVIIRTARLDSVLRIRWQLIAEDGVFPGEIPGVREISLQTPTWT
jgi:hypothetical protein